MTDIVKHEQLEVVKALNSSDEFAFEMYSDNLTIKLSYAKPTIAQLYKTSKKSDVMKILYQILKLKLSGMGKRAELSDIQMRMFVQDWIKLRASETIEDLILMLDFGRQGRYGKLFGDLDVMTLNDWAAKYFDQKYEVVERLLQNESKLHRFDRINIDPKQSESLIKELDKIGKEDKS